MHTSMGLSHGAAGDDADDDADIDADDDTPTQTMDDDVDNNAAIQTTGYNVDDGQRCRRQQRSRRCWRQNADDKVT